MYNYYTSGVKLQPQATVSHHGHVGWKEGGKGGRERGR